MALFWFSECKGLFNLCKTFDPRKFFAVSMSSVEILALNIDYCLISTHAVNYLRLYDCCVSFIAQYRQGMFISTLLIFLMKVIVGLFSRRRKSNDFILLKTKEYLNDVFSYIFHYNLWIASRLIYVSQSFAYSRWSTESKHYHLFDASSFIVFLTYKCLRFFSLCCYLLLFSYNECAIFKFVKIFRCIFWMQILCLQGDVFLKDICFKTVETFPHILVFHRWVRRSLHYALRQICFAEALYVFILSMRLRANPFVQRF